MNFLDDRLPERFWNKVQPCPMTGCWIWTGALTGNGYGAIRIERRNKLAHRYAYRLLVGEIPDGLELDHRTCSTPPCVNPSHLEPVTHAENVRRGRAGEPNATKQTCPLGHPFDHQSTHRGITRRGCLTCRRARSLAFYYAKPRLVAVVIGIGVHFR